MGKSFVTRISGHGRTSFKRLSASLHVKEMPNLEVLILDQKFQTPFGITACERKLNGRVLSEDEVFQTPFGITACER